MAAKKGELLERAASHWDAHPESNKKALITRWWESETLRRLVDLTWYNATGGCLTSGDYIRRETGRQTLGTGISIGCGAAEDEINLLQQGILERLILCDVSNEQLNRAEAYARKLGIASGRLERRGLVDFDKPLGEKVDLVYWRQSLHHMFDVRKTLEWCRDGLTPDGAIYCNDACAPNYMQWGEDVLKWSELYRSTLPRAYLENPHAPGTFFATRPDVPGIDFWMKHDPTECADSGNIIPAIRALAPTGRIAFLGGCIYGFALNDILHNFSDDAAQLENAMRLDKFMSDAGMNCFFTCVLKRSDFR
jgi:SAM-dependent methyltransferase